MPIVPGCPARPVPGIRPAAVRNVASSAPLTTATPTRRTERYQGKGSGDGPCGAAGVDRAARCPLLCKTELLGQGRRRERLLRVIPAGTGHGGEADDDQQKSEQGTGGAACPDSRRHVHRVLLFRVRRPLTWSAKPAISRPMPTTSFAGTRLAVCGSSATKTSSSSTTSPVGCATRTGALFSACTCSG